MDVGVSGHPLDTVRFQLVTSLIALKAPLAEPVQPVANLVRGRVPSVHSAWVQFTSHELEQLGKHLDSSAIDELVDACNLAGALYHAKKTNPISFSSIRLHLLKVAEVSDQLGRSLDLNSRFAMTLISLLEFECKGVKGMPNSIELSRLLLALSVGCSRQATVYAGQARRQTPEYQVRLVTRVLEPRGIRVSAAPGSRFVRLVRICFEAMGIHIDPGRAVRTYMRHRDDESFAA